MLASALQSSWYASEDACWQDVMDYVNLSILEALFLLGYSAAELPEALFTATQTEKTENVIEEGTLVARRRRAEQGLTERFAASVERSDGLRLPLLVKRLGCEPVEAFILFLLLLGEWDQVYRKLYGLLNLDGRESCTCQTVINALTASEMSRREVLGILSQGSRFCRLAIEPVQGSQLLDRPLRCKTQVMDYLLCGEEALFWRGCYKEVYLPAQQLPELLPEQICYIPPNQSSGFALYHITGRPETGRKSNVRAYAHERGVPALFISLTVFLEHEETLWDILWDGLAYAAVLCLVDEGNEPLDSGRLSRVITQAEQELPFLFIVSEREEYLCDLPEKVEYFPLDLELSQIKFSHRFWKWICAREGIAPELAVEAAGRFQFSPGCICRAVRCAKARQKLEGTEMTEKMLFDACRRAVSHIMWKKSDLVELPYQWEDLILPETSKQLIAQACAQVRRRIQVLEEWGFSQKAAHGTGVSMVFTGAPGTGKTMAASVVANQLSMALYRVDLATVVSKYVGETEKNLKEIFEEAEKCRAVLFFDEADVLFGKRTEMKDSHDKYNNMEAAFLLQKMEDYQGVSILATNYLQNFDEAFKRRVKFIIEFPFPDAQYRRKLWIAAFPDRAPLAGELDTEYLARSFELSGSAIKNAALHAAFLAADEGKAIDMGHLLSAVKNEYRKLGKVLGKEDLREYSYLAGGDFFGSG